MRTVLEVDGLFDGERVVSNAAIVVVDDTIAWAGKRGAVPKTPHGERSELRKAPGRFALPGLINCHAHLTLDGEPNFSAEVRQSDALAALKAFRNAAAVEEAHKAGLRITTHAHGAGGMRIAAEAGVDSIEHATLMDQRTVRDLKERDIPIVPTLCAVHFILENAATLPPVVVERTRAVSERHREGVRLARKAGVRIAAGTDAGSPFNRHERYAVELRLLAECGLSEEEVLIAATSTAAAVIGRENAGHIGAGCDAD